MAYQAGLDEVHQKALASFLSFKPLSVEYRLTQLRRLKTALEALKEDMNAALLTDLGRSHMSARISESDAVVDMCSHAIEHLRTWIQPEPRESIPLFITASAEVHHQPYGAALIIGSWNFPFDVTLGPLIDAIAAGNTVVVKPSELSPACSDVIEKAVSALDKDCYQSVQGGPEVVTYLLTKRWDVICFTGSGAKGKLVARAAAEHMTPTILELGGKNPAIVDETADLTNAALRITQGRFINAGQLCLSPEYVLVHKSIEQAFCTALIKTIGDFYGADPKSSPDLGRMVSEDATKRAAALLEGHGGETLLGGQISIEEKYISPTVIRNPSLNSSLMQEENFAPILTLLTYTDFAECVDFINSRPRPLGVYYFGSSAGHFSLLKQKTWAGALLQNECAFHFVVHDLPFGGIGDSGQGRTHGRSGFNAFSNAKAVFRNDTLNMFPISTRYPPYTPQSEVTFFRAKACLGCLVAVARCRPMRWVRRHWLALILAVLWLLEPKHHLAAQLIKRISS